MEREKGYLIIDDLKKLDKKVDGGFCDGWYTDGKTEYLFKKELDLIAYNELFYSQLLRKIGLKVVEYDLANQDGIKGVISTNYNSNHLPYFTVEDILEKYTLSYDEHYNLEKLCDVMNWFCDINNFKYYGNVQNDLLLQFIIQILLGNRDLRATNIEFYYDDSLKMAPFYDFGYYGFIILNAEEDEYKLSYNHITCSRNAFNELQYFLKNGKNNEIILLKEYLEKLKEVDLNKIIKEIKEQTEKNIPKLTKELLIYQVTSSLEDVEDVLKLNL